MKKNGNTAIAAQDQADTTVKSAESAQPVETIVTVKPTINTLDFNGRCGNCTNPHVSMYGEGQWRCICGAHS